MGMFDTIKIHRNLLPITVKERKSFEGYEDFQTKTLDCTLSYIQLLRNGYLKYLKCPETPTLNNTIIDVGERLEMYFYSDIKGTCYEFKAEFVNSKLVSLTRFI